MTELREQPEKHQSGEPETPREAGTLFASAPEENPEPELSESESLSTAQHCCEKLRKIFQLMKDQRPSVEKLFVNRLNNLGIKPVSSHSSLRFRTNYKLIKVS